MLLDSLSPSLASYCFRIKCHISETALNSHFSTLAYFEYFISCIELSFPDIGILNSVWTMCCHTCFHVFPPLWKEGRISSSCHSFRIQHIPLPGDFLSIHRFSVLGSLHLKYFWLKYCVDMETVMFIILCLLYTVVSSWREEPLADSSQFLRT